jgi:hypothetical protein
VTEQPPRPNSPRTAGHRNSAHRPSHRRACRLWLTVTVDDRGPCVYLDLVQLVAPPVTALPGQGSREIDHPYAGDGTTLVARYRLMPGQAKTFAERLTVAGFLADQRLI